MGWAGPRGRVSGNIQVRLKGDRIATVRPATADDAQTITELVNIVGAERRFVLRERATWSLEEERTTLASAGGHRAAFFVAEVDGSIRGIINLRRGEWSKDRHLAELGMSCLPEYRSIGLGTALLERGIEWARSVGVRKLTLEVFATNVAAIALYRKKGFQEEARLRGQYVIDGAPIDGVLMALWL
jgi:RimJ/RimL family protein N-acetyltransferase